MAKRRELHFNLNFRNSGCHTAGWRWPGNDPRAFIDPQFFVRVAQLAERGTFDAVFFADHPGLDNPEHRPYEALEPTILLATIAAATSHIGLVATATSSYNDPYNLARRLATLDHVSGGRAAWNVVTTADTASSANFGEPGVFAHSARYQRADEFVQVVKDLWDSWEDDAFLGDVANGRFVESSRVHRIDHKGDHFSVRGPLQVPRSPQGRLPVFQAGGSEDGINLAARHADGVFSVAYTLDEAVEYAAALRARAADYGRGADSILILPGLVTIIGGTEAEAKRREQELWDLVPLDYALGQLAGRLRIDRALLKLDEPLPENIPLPVDNNQTFFLGTVNLARRGNLTVRELLRAQGGAGTGHRIVVGTPEQIADGIEEWFLTGAVAGFNLMPDVFPSGLEDFVDGVVPILRRRGLFRTEYQGHTLRDHFGLERPASRFARQPKETVLA